MWLKIGLKASRAPIAVLLFLPIGGTNVSSNDHRFSNRAAYDVGR